MSEFRTVLPQQKAPIEISYQDQLLSLGSCFAVHIGERLKKYKFQILNNPFGIIYNPHSLVTSLERLENGRKYQIPDLFEHQGLWHSFDHHGFFSHPDRMQTLAAINRTLDAGHKQYNQCSRLLLTLGTAYVFKYKTNDRIVANCHKLPNSAFDRHRLTQGNIVGSLTQALRNFQKKRPDLQVILTISPVRHLRDGMIENQRSKAQLVLAVAEICRTLDFVHYFPAYELQLDDLRDYRFYGRDLSHPNELAIEYIWEYFTNAFFQARNFRYSKKSTKNCSCQPASTASPRPSSAP